MNQSALDGPEGTIPMKSIKDSDSFLLWKPVLKLSNLVSIKFNSLLEAPKYVLIGHDAGTNKTIVYYDMMLQVEVSCPMIFEDFPFDIQTCPFTVSYLMKCQHKCS